MGSSKEFKLIVTIIAKEKTDQVIKAIEQEGIKKSTILLSRGVSDNNPMLMGITIEPQREVIYTLAPQTKVDRIFDAIVKAGNLDKPLQGLVFVLDVEKVGGIDLSMFE